MKKEEIHLGDWQRILIGNTPWEFMLEVLIRTVLIYLILLITMRFLGKRMSTSVSTLDMAIMVTLGAIVSPAMQLPERGLILAIVALVCIATYQRLISWLSYKNRKIELLSQGDVAMLIKNGVIQVDQLRRSVLSHEQLYEQLRRRKIYHLGQVKRVYLEGSGQFSIFKYAQQKPGLCIFPNDDEPLYKGTPRSNKFLTCKNCGTVIQNQKPSAKPCPFCRVNDWDKAVDVDEEESVNAASVYTHMH